MCFVGKFTRSAVRWPQKQHGPLFSLWSFIFLSQTQHRSAVKVTVNCDCSFLAFPPSSHPTGQRIKSMSATCLSFTISFCFSVKPYTVPSIVQCEHHTGLHHSPLPEYKSHPIMDVWNKKKHVAWTHWHKARGISISLLISYVLGWKGFQGGGFDDSWDVLVPSGCRNAAAIDSHSVNNVQSRCVMHRGLFSSLTRRSETSTNSQRHLKL